VGEGHEPVRREDHGASDEEVTSSSEKKYIESGKTKSEHTIQMTKNPWLDHVAKYREKHPDKSYKDCLHEAKETYKRQSISKRVGNGSVKKAANAKAPVKAGTAPISKTSKAKKGGTVRTAHSKVKTVRTEPTRKTSNLKTSLKKGGTATSARNAVKVNKKETKANIGKTVYKSFNSSNADLFNMLKKLNLFVNLPENDTLIPFDLEEITESNIFVGMADGKKVLVMWPQLMVKDTLFKSPGKQPPFVSVFDIENGDGKLVMNEKVSKIFEERMEYYRDRLKQNPALKKLDPYYVEQIKESYAAMPYDQIMSGRFVGKWKEEDKLEYPSLLQDLKMFPAFAQLPEQEGYHEFNLIKINTDKTVTGRTVDHGSQRVNFEKVFVKLPRDGVFKHEDNTIVRALRLDGAKLLLNSDVERALIRMNNVPAIERQQQANIINKTEIIRLLRKLNLRDSRGIFHVTNITQDNMIQGWPKSELNKEKATDVIINWSELLFIPKGIFKLRPTQVFMNKNLEFSKAARAELHI